MSDRMPWSKCIFSRLNVYKDRRCSFLVSRSLSSFEKMLLVLFGPMRTQLFRSLLAIEKGHLRTLQHGDLRFTKVSINLHKMSLTNATCRNLKLTMSELGIGT